MGEEAVPWRIRVTHSLRIPSSWMVGRPSVHDDNITDPHRVGFFDDGLWMNRPMDLWIMWISYVDM